MTSVATTKYGDYSIRVDEEPSTTEVFYEDRGPDVLRVHYRAFRVPSRREFIIRHFVDATEADRRNAEKLIPKIPRLFEEWERGGQARKKRHRTEGHYYWTVCLGTFLDDPFVQLELEAMIDLESEVTA